MRSGVGAFNYRRRFVHDDEFFIRWNNQHFDFGTIGEMKPSPLMNLFLTRLLIASPKCYRVRYRT